MSIVIEEMTSEKFAKMLEEENADRASHALTPDDLEPLERWVNQGIPPGSFLEAVLKNNLSEACGRADLYNRRRLFEYVQYIYNETPSQCWGSPERYENWIALYRAKFEKEKSEE